MERDTAYIASAGPPSDRPARPPARIFFSAAEPSADLHGAALIRALRDQGLAFEAVGLAGPLMQAEGCTAIADMTAHAAMGAGAIRQVPRGLRVLRTCREHLKAHAYDLAVVIDSPTLNLPIARVARRAGIPVLYYIAPQIWGWGRWRVNRVRQRVTRLACLLPFEEAFFKTNGIDAEFVGHPLFDTLADRPVDNARVKAVAAFGKPVIAVLPGSRRHVIDEVFPGQIEVATAIAGQFPGSHFCISVASDTVQPAIESHLREASFAHSLHKRENGEILTAADLAIVASGTATLETGFYRTPMIVMYNGSCLGWHLLIRWVVEVEQLSLINILAGREIVPEYMPYYRSTAPIASKAIELLGDDALRDKQREEIEQVLAPLRKRGAHARAARIVAEMLPQ